MVAERLDDWALRRLLQQGLNAGGLDTDGTGLPPVPGPPPGGVVSPILAKVFGRLFGRKGPVLSIAP